MAGTSARSQECSVPFPPRPLSRDISYFTARAVEELDRAEAARDDAVRLVHEQLATNYLKAALRLRHGEIVRIVA